MINKTKALKNGLSTITDGTIRAEEQRKLLERLQDLLPNVVNSDGQLDINALNDAFDISRTTSNNKGYELTFAGKGIARAMADSSSPAELTVVTEQSKNFEETENVVIRGDNLDVLKILLDNYHKKIKMIYIDPPYNTTSANFIYFDDFRKSNKQLITDLGLDEGVIDFLQNAYGTQTHSGWLAFMYPRLKLARELLRNDGVIFISIDDHERANLKIICDEIFGEMNFQYNISVVNNLNGNDNSSGMMETQESCLVYSKNSIAFEMGVLPVFEEKTNNEWRIDESGYWKKGGSLKATGEEAQRAARPKLFFPIYINEANRTFSLNNDEGYEFKLLPITNGNEMRWYWSKEKFAKDAHEVIIEKTRDGYSLYKKQRPALGDLPSQRGKTTFYKRNYSNSHGTAELKKIFNNEKVFDYPKSLSLIKDFISLGNCKGELVLDFFAGSGTTGDAVMQLNAEDDGNRKFILVQLDEKINNKAEAYKFCKENKLNPRVISSICIERLNRAGENLKNTIAKENGTLLQSKTLDVGYKVYCTTHKPQVTEDGELFTVDHPRKTTADTLANMLINTCKPLHISIECIITDKLYRADNEIYLLDNIPIEDLEPYKDLKINLDGWADINLEQALNIRQQFDDNISVIY